jgi:hypothetical protein
MILHLELNDHGDVPTDGVRLDEQRERSMVRRAVRVPERSRATSP